VYILLKYNYSDALICSCLSLNAEEPLYAANLKKGRGILNGMMAYETEDCVMDSL
jgi:hypothetical protein